jgi:DNA-binding phage protein
MGMGNELADAIRAALADEVIKRCGSLVAGAERSGIPYKTFYRALTEDGRDRTKSVSLDFVLEVCSGLGISFDEVLVQARKRSQR